jgi:hypothetical protein
MTALVHKGPEPHENRQDDRYVCANLDRERRPGRLDHVEELAKRFEDQTPNPATSDRLRST